MADILTPAAILLALGYMVLGVLAGGLYVRWRTFQGAANDVVDEEIIAVLAAAAHEAVGAPVRIHRARLRRDLGTELWSRAGRADVMTSHRVERKR